MKIIDPLYGESQVEEWLVPLLSSAAVQRLRWISLSNVASLSFPMIAGISRYAHCLGVCILAGRLADHLGFDKERKKTLMAAGLLHDAGIPPLGHLTEEALRESGIKFDHETSLRLILLDEGRRFFQLADGNKLGVIDAFARAGIDGINVFETIQGGGELGRFIAAEIDLDNIDNVVRIYRGIFGEKGGYNPLELAVDYFVTGRGKEAAISKWKQVRVNVYEKLMFSLEDFSQKATIKRVIRAYVNKLRARFEDHQLLDLFRFWSDQELTAAITSDLKNSEEHTSLLAGKYDTLVQYGWASSLTENQVLQISRSVGDRFNNYYVDCIPDKRTKYSSRAARPEQGALVGLFSATGKTKYDKAASIYLQELCPDFIPKAIPEHSSSGTLQLGLV